jgi:hypothetical protein
MHLHFPAIPRAELEAADGLAVFLKNVFLSPGGDINAPAGNRKTKAPALAANSTHINPSYGNGRRNAVFR